MSEQAPTPESQDTEGTSSVIAAEQAEHAAQPPADLPSAQEADDARAADEALEEAAAEEAPAEPQTRESDADGDVLPEDSADPVQAFKDELAGKFGDWYVIHTYAGYENRVKHNLETRVANLDMEDYIFEVAVTIDEVTEIKSGQKKVRKQPRMPGYVLVRMDMNDAAWSVVRETPGVTSFVGNEGNATPVKHRDVAKFLLPKSAATGTKPEVNAEGETVVAMPEDEAPKKVTHDYQVGEAVTILSGALASVSATINAIDPETGKIEALVSIFGRETPVELSPTEIERIS